MLVFGDRYNLVRDNYIFPLLNYKVELDKLEFNNLKYALKNKIKGLKSIEDKKYEITFNRDDLLKALLGEIDYFYTRALVQYVNILKSKDALSSCWGVVTQYYFSFFTINTLLRMAHRGNTFLNSEDCKVISDILTALYGELIKVPKGNYVFHIKEYDDSTDLCLVLKKTDSGTHEQTWSTLETFLEELLKNKTKDDEYAFLKIIKQISDQYNVNFPSSIRNEVNYKPQYGYKSIKNEIRNFVPDMNLEVIVKEILKFVPSNDEDYKIKMSALYGNFFFIYSSKLLNEYLSRGNFSKKTQKVKVKYINKFGIDFPIFPDAI
ncbi:hypothetical protein A2U94_16345 [Bacillus sp. VT 712]|uniref:hypothetical protein n=1 Tax=Bacillaceae TaxID=186817 RepID=UPI000473E4C2|nr:MULTISPECIES: hypothetical protein [Bacillaceae]KZB90374.1 hypothetical protein A2U94_16345 [Bacillus sp. VT 712]